MVTVASLLGSTVLCSIRGVASDAAVCTVVVASVYAWHVVSAHTNGLQQKYSIPSRHRPQNDPKSAEHAAASELLVLCTVGACVEMSRADDESTVVIAPECVPGGNCVLDGSGPTVVAADGVTQALLKQVRLRQHTCSIVSRHSPQNEPNSVTHAGSVSVLGVSRSDVVGDTRVEVTTPPGIEHIVLAHRSGSQQRNTSPRHSPQNDPTSASHNRDPAVVALRVCVVGRTVATSDVRDAVVSCGAVAFAEVSVDVDGVSLPWGAIHTVLTHVKGRQHVDTRPRHTPQKAPISETHSEAVETSEAPV